MNIVVLGTGYVGLVTGTCLAQLGHHVTCIDQDKTKVASLQKGVCTIFEKSLEEFLKAGLAKDNLRFSSELAGSVESADFIFICVRDHGHAGGEQGARVQSLSPQNGDEAQAGRQPGQDKGNVSL